MPQSWEMPKAVRTWMMNRIIGFFGSYSLGLDPSSIPPWGAARSVEAAAEDEAVTVFVTTEEAMDGMMGDMKLIEVDYAFVVNVQRMLKWLWPCPWGRTGEIWL